MHDRQTGEDLYPEFRTRVAKMPASFELLSRRWLDTFGLFCATGDGHAAEYVGYGAETMELSGYDFDAYEQRGAAQWQHIRDVASGTQPPSFIASGERAAHIMCAITRDSNTHELSANFVNRGVIRNLPDDAIVETPATVNASGIHGMHVGELPTGIAAMMRQQIDIQELVVEAAVTGNRAAAMQALLLDPHIHSYAQADHLLDDLSQAHGFFGK
jgi:alpha-galactosidase